MANDVIYLHLLRITKLRLWSSLLAGDGDLNKKRTSILHLPSSSSRDVCVLVVEERKVVGNVFRNSGFRSFMLVALGTGGTRPGTREKKRTGVGHRSPKSLHMVQEEHLENLTKQS